MKTLGITLALTLATVSAAAADPIFYNSTSGTYSIELTQPNGEVDTTKIAGNRAGMSQSSFVIPPNTKSVKVTLKDDTDTVMWSGTVNADDTMVIVPDGTKVKPVYAGEHNSNASPHGIMFMNTTGIEMTIDLFGHNGVGSAKGIKPGATFDVKKMIKLEPNETTYDVVAKSKDGTDLKIESKVQPERYILVWKDPSDIFHADALGKIPTPTKTKKTK